ncbi:lytic transglycosylase domain-containing protein [Halocola ammonii]
MKTASTSRWAFLFGGVLAISGILYLSSFSAEEKREDDLYNDHVKSNYKVYSLSTPEEMTFAGEDVPLNQIDVKEKLDRELLVNTYWHSNTFLMHKRANRWFPVIEPILKENGVPEDFKYLSLIESGFENVVSPAGATGFWQFLESTGREYGLEINNEVDERYNVEKSTAAACEYLKDAYEIYGDWSLVAASYNMGRAGVNRQLARQKVDRYWDLLLNAETGRYVYRILAVKEILNNSGNYGFHLRPKDLYPPYETVIDTVDYSVENFAIWANERGINYKTLKTLNPWLRESYLNNRTGKAYEVKLPEDKSKWLGEVEEEKVEPTEKVMPNN